MSKEDRMNAAKEALAHSKKKDAKEALEEVSDNLGKASDMHAKDSKTTGKIAENMEGQGNPHYKVKKGSY